ncbi:MAG: acyl-CoA dehydratase activase [bacterium]|jgi:predicted CoA-substrate-specific enzyme activase
MQVGFLGIDVGSVSTKTVITNPKSEVLASVYIRTQGNPIAAIQEALQLLEEELREPIEIKAVGTTGSARTLAGLVVGADVVKNEITTHAIAGIFIEPEVQTILEIGGQDSKIIILRNGIVTDFAMNTVCAAGTGSFLEHQAARLNIPIEEFGDLALCANNPVRIAGRCAVFAESDMIHKQQTGHKIEDIIAGLCEALVRNYLNNVGKGKEILPPVLFQGGVAANAGICAAFTKALGLEIIVPEHYSVTGAIGAALLAQQKAQQTPGFQTRFRGFAVKHFDYKVNSFECKGCPNHCEVVSLSMDGNVLAYWGDRCGKWSNLF